MAYVIPGETIMQLSIVGDQFDQQTITTFHWKYDGPNIPDGRNALNLFGLLLDQPGGLMEAYANATPLSLVNIKQVLQWIAPQRFRSLVRVSAFNAGLKPTAELTNIACALTITGDEASRRAQATKHIPAPGDQYNDGIFDGGYTAAVGAIWQAYRATEPLLAGTMIPGIWGPPRKATVDKCGNVVPAVPSKWSPATGASVGDTVRVMRRRTVRIGV